MGARTPRRTQRAKPPLYGRAYGDWRVIARPRSEVYRVQCRRCEDERDVRKQHLGRLPEQPCPCDPSEPDQPLPVLPILVDHWTPWEEDDRCWAVVTLHPEGLTPSQVGELMGVTRMQIYNLEQSAYRTIARLAKTDTAAVALRDMIEGHEPYAHEGADEASLSDHGAESA